MRSSPARLMQIRRSTPLAVTRMVCLMTALLPGLAWVQNAAAADGPLAPPEALERFEIESGLRIELVASEPQVVDPVSIAFDAAGRLYVVEMRDYPADPGRPIGRVALLEDGEGDGHYETRHEFAEGLSSPNGIAVWKGGIFVTCAPDVLYLEDTDGDLRADHREVVLTGFSLGDSSQLRVNHPTFGPDNWIYLANGLSGGSIVMSGQPQRPPVKPGRGDARFRPGTDQLEVIGGFAQFGLSFDDYGRRFICSNRRHCDQVVLEPAWLQRNRHLAFTDTVADISDHGAAARVFASSRAVTTAAYHAGTFTAACGITVYRGSALGPDYQGNSFTCEPTGNLVHRDVLKPGGASMIAVRAAEKTEFLRSSDDWFRPVDLANGPDGALYVVDMYRKTIEHPRYLPETIRKITDFEGGNDRGRIWRITRASPSAATRPKRVDLSRADAEELAGQLGARDAWVRETAQRLLVERHDMADADLVRAAQAGAEWPPGRVHALWTLDGLGALEPSDILRALGDPEPGVRENAVRLAPRRLEHSHDLRQGTLALARDPDARVRFQTALSLGALAEEAALQALVDIAWRDLHDRYTRAAVLSSCAGRTAAFLNLFLSRKRLAQAEPLEGRAGLLQMVRLAGATLGAAEPIETGVETLADILDPDAEPAAWHFALVRGLIEGLRRERQFAAGTNALATLQRLAEKRGPDCAGALQRLAASAARVAEDPRARVESRCEAVALLAERQDDASFDTLGQLLAPETEQVVQLAAVEALTHGLEPRRLEALLARDAWETYLPPVRESIVTAALNRPNLLPLLLTALEAGIVPPVAIPPSRRDRLLQHADGVISERARKLFSQPPAGDRQKAYRESLAAIALPARAADGRAVFERLCSQCHQMEGSGIAVGPDLTGMRNQSPETLLLHIIVPDHEITPGYTNHVVETADGQILTGLLAAETPTSITLRLTQAQEHTVLRSQIARIYADSLSMMPQELEKNMTAQELADLIAYLRGQPDAEPRSEK